MVLHCLSFNNGYGDKGSGQIWVILYLRGIRKGMADWSLRELQSLALSSLLSPEQDYLCQYQNKCFFLYSASDRTVIAVSVGRMLFRHIQYVFCFLAVYVPESEKNRITNGAFFVIKFVASLIPALGDIPLDAVLSASFHRTGGSAKR